MDVNSDSNKKLQQQLKTCLSRSYYLSLLRTIYPNIDENNDILNIYLSDPLSRVFSLNPFFDETFYRSVYADVTERIVNGQILSGLVHFIRHGCQEGRAPNRLFYNAISSCPFPLAKADSIKDLPRNLFVSENFLDFYQFFPATDHMVFFNNYGRFFNKEDNEATNFTKNVRLLFDHKFYNQKYIKNASLTADELFNNYMTEGLAERRSPNTNFDEEFYLAFYPDIRKVVNDGVFKCGYQHFLLSGESEGRLAKYDLTRSLEAQMPSITNPVAIKRIRDLERKIEISFFLDPTREQRTINFVLPDLNPDIFFGGYDSIINLITLLKRAGKKLRIIKSQSIDPSIDYLLYHWKGKSRYEIFADIEVCGRADLVAVGPDDRFITYSAWDGYLANKMASVTSCKRFTYLIQEYEPIFTEYNAFHFLTNAAYAFPHYAIFNSPELVSFFKSKKLGVFSGPKVAKADSHYSILNHVLTPLECGLNDKKKNRTFFYYARPEAHAGRNLFEIGIMVLKKVLSEHPIGSEWRFIGLGALTPVNTVPLGKGHVMEIKNKLPIDEYIQFTRQTDIAFSLMWAPHPSLVPFEMLQTGALVVTNTFENRSKAYIEGLSSNLIAAEPTLDSLTEALWEAFERSSDIEKRKQGVVRLGYDDWSQAFSKIITNLQQEDLI